MMHLLWEQGSIYRHLTVVCVCVCVPERTHIKFNLTPYTIDTEAHYRDHLVIAFNSLFLLECDLDCLTEFEDSAICQNIKYYLSSNTLSDPTRPVLVYYLFCDAVSNLHYATYITRIFDK